LEPCGDLSLKLEPSHLSNPARVEERGEVKMQEPVYLYAERGKQSEVIARQLGSMEDERVYRFDAAHPPRRTDELRVIFCPDGSDQFAGSITSANATVFLTLVIADKLPKDAYQLQRDFLDPYYASLAESDKESDLEPVHDADETFSRMVTAVIDRLTTDEAVLALC